MVTAGGCPAPEVAGQPPDGVVVQWGSVNEREEFGMVYRIKFLGKVY